MHATRCTHLLTFLVIAILIQPPTLAQDTATDFPALPSGSGIAAQHPGDQDIAKHPAVLFSDDFEDDSLPDILRRWNSTSEADTGILAISQNTPNHAGSQSIKVTAKVPQNTGGYLYKRLDKPVDRAFARFYVKFQDPPQYIHHFTHFGGYYPGTNWAQGGAGERPIGNDRITVGIEPFGHSGRVPPPGDWNFYAYWHEMKGSADGNYWGNSIQPPQRHPVPVDRWQCVEYMIELNDLGQPNGRLALWLDGELIMDAHQGSPSGRWTGLGFQLHDTENPPAESQPFHGFDFRTSNDLQINFFWLLHYVTETNQRRNRVPDITEPNSVWFDHVVVATEYIGPIAPLDSATNTGGN